MAYIDNIPKVPASSHTPANRRKGDIRVVVIHDMEAPERSNTAENIAAYFAREDVRASAHINVDNDSAVRSVDDEDIAWAAPGCNHDGLQVELAGYARQSRAEWLDAYSKATMDRAARITAEYCQRYGLNIKHLTDDELRAGHSGIIGHVQASNVYKRSSHWDPGPNFPWDWFMARVRHYAGGGTAPSDPAPNTIRPGDRGPLVQSWQRDLLKWNKNALPLYGADGGFGDETTEWTNKFFMASGLTTTPVESPVVGPKSRQRMEQVLTGKTSTEKPDFKVVVLYDSKSEVDEGMARVFGKKNQLKVLPFNTDGPTYKSAFLVGAVAKKAGKVRNFIEDSGFDPKIVKLAGSDRHETAEIVKDAIEKGFRAHRMDY